MRRTFLKNGQFVDTMTCFLGDNFIGNGHWIINTQYASNRKKFESEALTRDFLKDGTSVIRKHLTIEQVVADFTKDNPLIECEVSDLAIGKGVLVNINDKLNSLQAAYANLLKQIHGSEDVLMANDKIFVAYDKEGTVGLVVHLYDLGDLIDSNRNRSITKLLGETMGLKMNDE